jgi:hypothetical protein
MKKILSRITRKRSAKVRKKDKKITKQVTTSRTRRKKSTKVVSSKKLISPKKNVTSSQKEKENVEKAKFTTQQIILKESLPQVTFSLPSKYGDDRLILLVRDPWWLYTYWDISEYKINKVISSIPVYERKELKWILRVYDITGQSKIKLEKAHSFFDIEISFDAGNWYINVNQPERAWIAEIGLKNPWGNFFPIVRSNIVKTPYFGISHLIDEEWAFPEEEYYKIIGIPDLGKSSLEIRKRFEEFFKKQISSPLASWGISGFFPPKVPKDKFFLEVWTEIILYGRTTPDAEVTVQGKKINLRKDGTFSIRYALPDGDFKFEVVATSKNKKYKIKKTPAVKKYNI